MIKNRQVQFLTLILILTAALVFLGIRQENTPVATEPVLSQKQSPQPTSCPITPTPSQTEGPYYKIGSPQSKNIAEGVDGQKLTVEGFVYDKNCKPLPNTWLDFWQANANGVYDNAGFTLRGHQFTDENGRFDLETIIPSSYQLRPPHIHVKVKTADGPVLTSQLYFPNQSLNQTDSIFNGALVVELRETRDGKVAEFNFVLNQ